MGYKILAIDDSLTLRRFIENVLARHSAGYQVTTAKDGSEGLRMAISSSPDIILLDYILPDMKGEEVCRQLMEQPEVSRIPVVLMSSSGEEIKKARRLYKNVANSLAKPFTPELLKTTIGDVLRNIPAAAKTGPAIEAAPAPTRVELNLRKLALGVSLSGHTGIISLADAMRVIEEDTMTGVLRLRMEASTIEVFARSGHVILATTRNVNLYLKDSTYNFQPHDPAAVAAAQRRQEQDGCPIFLGMAETGALPREKLFGLVDSHSHRLFSRLWTGGRVYFEFEELDQMPPWVDLVPPNGGIMDEWLLETLRPVGEECFYSYAWGEPTGIPMFNRFGFERIQELPLEEPEVEVVSQINGVNSLQYIANNMGNSADDAVPILFRFLSLKYIEYWPVSVLTSANREEAVEAVSE